MPELVGGLLARLVKDSFIEMVRDALGDLGWFDATIHDTPPGTRRHRPVSISGKAADWDTVITPNLLTITTERSEDYDVELGSQLVEVKVPYAVDIYAESESLAIDLSGDVVDILRGRHETVGRERSSFTIFDYRTATASAVGTAKISNVTAGSIPLRFEKPWLANWITVMSTVGYHTGLYEED